jgi:hypothetical protein
LSRGEHRLYFIGVSYWLKAGVVQITTRDKNPHNPEHEIRGNPDSEGHRVLHSSTAIEQTELNKSAAIYTAIAVVFQAAATFLDMLR